MKKVNFDLKYKEKIINGMAKVFYNDNPVRIICWDRETGYSPGVNPIVGLLKSNCGYSETIVTISENGTLSVPGMGITSNCVYVHVPELPSRLYRVKYILTTLQCPETLWKKYGYVEDENESFHTNAMRFINNVAPLHITELHDDLKERGDWTYDDDEDWDFNFKVGETLICLDNGNLPALEVGRRYTITEVNHTDHLVTIKNVSGKTVGIPFFPCLDLFTRSYEYEREGKYDFTQMKAFTPVLARTGDHQTWFPHFFESYHPQNHGGEFYMLDEQHSLHRYSQCVPYEGNEHLLKTQDPIPPYYDIREK